MMSNFSNTLIQVTSEGMGRGDKALSIQLINNYFKLLVDNEQLPKIIVFYNAGVKLLENGHNSIEFLSELKEKGVLLIACTTCLNCYGLIENLALGQKGTMHDIIELQGKADKVVTL